MSMIAPSVRMSRTLYFGGAELIVERAMSDAMRMTGAKHVGQDRAHDDSAHLQV